MVYLKSISKIYLTQVARITQWSKNHRLHLLMRGSRSSTHPGLKESNITVKLGSNIYWPVDHDLIIKPLISSNVGRLPNVSGCFFFGFGYYFVRNQPGVGFPDPEGDVWIPKGGCTSVLDHLGSWCKSARHWWNSYVPEPEVTSTAGEFMLLQLAKHRWYRSRYISKQISWMSTHVYDDKLVARIVAYKT